MTFLARLARGHVFALLSTKGVSDISVPKQSGKGNVDEVTSKFGDNQIT
jgi:hypothetical protein